MKTKNLFISGLIGLFASCSSQNCKIEGTVENAKDGDTLKLLRDVPGDVTVTIDKAITFEFSHFMSPQSAYLQAGHLNDRYKEYFNIR